jgi:acetoacetyl-CoA synthetase
MVALVDVPRKLWEHPSPESTQMGVFKSRLEKAKGVNLAVRNALISKR